MATSLCDLYARLRRDTDRDRLGGFSKDFADPHKVLHDRFVRDPERREALECWLQGKNHQPCLFGRIAAKRDGIDYCFLTVEDLVKSDDHIRNKIAVARRIWKNRALRGEPRHGFLLSVCDEKVAMSAADEALRQFSLHLQTLAGWPTEPTETPNDIVNEWLYLKNPKTGKIVKFTFTVDFFATAGDKRWWHDHRIPGGIAFTANSLGHMVCQQLWYEERNVPPDWALRTAMLTIESAAKDVPHGPATYLRDEKHGPLRPYPWTAETKPSDLEKLKGKDCGSYGGYLHTDHAVRDEFFEPHNAPARKETPYHMDFTYIFDKSDPHYLPFMLGEEVEDRVVEEELGRPADMRIIDSALGQETAAPVVIGPLGTQVSDALSRCRQWRLTDDEVNALLG